MRAIISRFLADQTGATVVEYALIAAGLSLVIVAGVGTASNSLVDFWSRMANDFDNGWH